MANLVFIKNFPNRAFAEQAKEILKNESIGCIITSPDVGIIGTSTSSISSGVDLYVDEADESRAKVLLEALFDGI